MIQKGKNKLYILILYQDGVVIVDSPDVGESEIMGNIVVNYFPNAFAFNHACHQQQ